MYQYQNPVNDFCFRNAQQQYGYQFPHQQASQVVSRFVTSIDEAKTAIINPFSYNLFLDSGSGKIYLKKLGNDGRSDSIAYSSEETAAAVKEAAATQDKNEDALKEINARLSRIEKTIGKLKNDKSIPGNAGAQQSDEYAEASASRQNEPDAAAESAGFQKNAGNAV